MLFYTAPRLTLLTMLAVPPIVFATSVFGRRVKSPGRGRAEGALGSGGRRDRSAGRHPYGPRVLAGSGRGRALRSADGARARARAPEGPGQGGARRRLARRRRVRGAPRHLGRRQPHRGRPHDDRGAHLVHPVRAARRPRIPQRLTVHGRFAAGDRRHRVGVRSARPKAAHPGRRRRTTRRLGPVGHAASTCASGIRHGPEVEALQGVDLRIEPGEVVALVGKSGSGKSTLLNLILRFYDPNEGRVLVGGHDVRELDPAWLRGHIATVMQEPTLFSRTVGENISYGVSPADARAIAAAAALACADEFIDRLPGGYDAPVGDRGVQLSGGQRQRLAIARAVLRRPKILILDEATSALDAELESVVQVALRAIGYRPTTLIIAHRLVDGRQRRPRRRPRPGPDRRERHARRADPHLHVLPAARADPTRRSMSRTVEWYRSSSPAPDVRPSVARVVRNWLRARLPNRTSAARRSSCTRGRCSRKYG